MVHVWPTPLTGAISNSSPTICAPLRSSCMDLSVQGLPRVPVPLAVTGGPPGRPDAHAPDVPSRLKDAVAAPATSTMLSVFLPRICFLLRSVASPAGPSVGGHHR